MSGLFVYTSPVLEAVFVDLAPAAANIADIFLQDGGAQWQWGPLSYSELAEWTDELRTDIAVPACADIA